MRISTASFYEQSQGAMGALQGKLLRMQQQIASGQKMLAPSDDPLAATRALAVSQSIALNGQYEASRAQARQTLSLEENALQGATEVLQGVKSLLVQAGGATLTDADRAALATELQSRHDQLLGLANSDDGNGQYLFAGFRSQTPPFVRQADGRIGYSGDAGQRLMQVDVARQMPACDTGQAIFLSVQGGAGAVSQADAANTGTGTLGPLVAAPGAVAGAAQDWEIAFGADGASYALFTGTPPVAAGAPQPFVAGQAITVGSLQLTLEGQPAAGDRFTVRPAQQAGTDIFAALGEMVQALREPQDARGPSVHARFQNALATAHQKIDNAHDNVITVRASVGSRLQELESLATTADSRNLLDRSYLSDLVDLDYASAIGEMMQRQAALQASQQTFVRIQGLSLFQHL